MHFSCVCRSQLRKITTRCKSLGSCNIPTAMTDVLKALWMVSIPRKKSFKMAFRGSCSLCYTRFSKRSCRNSRYQTMYFLNDSSLKCIYIYIAFSCLNVLLLSTAKIKAVSLYPVGKRGINSYTIHFTDNNTNIYIISLINLFDELSLRLNLCNIPHRCMDFPTAALYLYTYRKRLVRLILPPL